MIDTEQNTTAKSEPLYFADRAERENYYRWAYCVKHGITNMEDFGVKPLGSMTEPKPAERKPSSSKTIDLDLTPGMVAALRGANGAVWLAGKACRWTWNLFALLTLGSIIAMLIGVATA